MNNYDHLIPVDKARIIKKENMKLISTALIPSSSHSYALAVEYIQKWFLSKFSKNYFKTVYIEGKNIFDESRRFNIDNTARRQNPSVAIIPSIDFSFDRDTLDLSLGGLDLYDRKSSIDTCFFKDYANKLYIKEIAQINLINFTIKVYVDTRAKQLNLWHYMRQKFRVQATQGEYCDIDYSIPEELMLQLAIDTGFDVDLENKKIKNITGFLNYLNRNSLLPFIYKLRCENGRDEFFFRGLERYVHIAIPDPLSVEDGERVGHVYENFAIEMNLQLRFPVPQSFVYLSKNPQKVLEGIKMEDYGDIVGLYSLKLIDIPPMNQRGWNLYIQTEYLEDKLSDIITIEFDSLFNEILKDVISNTIKEFLSPKLFIDIQLFDEEQTPIPYNIDWETLIITTEKTNRKYQKIIIAVYIDNKYMNEAITTMNNYTDKRISSSKTQ